MAGSANPLTPNLSGRGFESRVAHAQTARGTVTTSGANVAFVPDVGSSVRVHLESETCVCSFSSELLFVFELLNLSVFSMYVLFPLFTFFPFCAALRAVRGLGPANRCLQLYFCCCCLCYVFMCIIVVLTVF